MTDGHIVTTIEPVWVRSEYRLTPSGEPEYLTGSQKVIGDHGMEPIMDDALYECSCGVEFESWSDVEEHFETVARHRPD